MKIKVELTKEEIEVLKQHLVFRMQWIQAGMDEKEPLDRVLAKVLDAAEKQSE